MKITPSTLLFLLHDLFYIQKYHIVHFMYVQYIIGFPRYTPFFSKIEIFILNMRVYYKIAIFVF